MDVVRLSGVVKRFHRRYGAPSAQEQKTSGRRARVDVALDGIDLVVEAGEVVGLLGTRRSGRTSLLAVVSGVLEPDEGTAQVRGRATGLVAMNAGFTGTASVGHNLRLNAMLLGLSRAQLDERLDAVLADAGVSHALLPLPLRDLPGPRRQRLGYAMAMRADPDVFLADKTLTVGDKQFREKGLVSMEAHRDAGRALILATNDGRILRRLCTRGVVMRSGQVVFDGRIRKALQEHRQMRAE